MLRPTFTVLFLAAFGVAYLLSDSFRAEVDRAVGVLASGDIEALRGYILSYGAWAPLISAALMVLQALLAFLQSFVLAFANGLAFGALWGGVLSLASAALAAAISFGIAHVLGRALVEAIIGKDSLGIADKWFATGRMLSSSRVSSPSCRSTRSPTPPASRGWASGAFSPRP